MFEVAINVVWRHLLMAVTQHEAESGECPVRVDFDRSDVEAFLAALKKRSGLA